MTFTRLGETWHRREGDFLRHRTPDTRMRHDDAEEARPESDPRDEARRRREAEERQRQEQEREAERAERDEMEGKLTTVRECVQLWFGLDRACARAEITLSEVEMVLRDGYQGYDRESSYQFATGAVHRALSFLPAEQRDALAASDGLPPEILAEIITSVTASGQLLHDVLDDAGLPAKKHPRSKKSGNGATSGSSPARGRCRTGRRQSRVTYTLRQRPCVVLPRHGHS